MDWAVFGVGVELKLRSLGSAGDFIGMGLRVGMGKVLEVVRNKEGACVYQCSPGRKVTGSTG